jgi:hypothetical protein
MKRKLLIGFATIGLLLTACSQDEVVSAVGAISFDGAHVDKHTRATANTITTDNIKEIYVYGYRSNVTNSAAGAIFNNEKVSKGSDGNWTYANTQYWVKDQDYAFTAITPSSTDAKWTYTPSDAKIDGKGTLTFNNETVDGEYDLCSDVQKVTPNTANYSTPVPFTLKHRLARVIFRFKNSYENNTDKIEVSKLVLKDVLKEGKMTSAPALAAGETSSDPVDGDWNTSASETFDLTFKSITTTTSTSDGSSTTTTDAISTDKPLTVAANSKTNDVWSVNTVDTDTKFLIPSTATSYDVEFKAEVKNTNSEGTINTFDKTDKNVASISIDGGFQEGFSYVILVEFTGNAIKFTVSSVTPWDKEESINLSSSSTPSNAPQTIDISGATDIDDGTKSNVKYYEGEVSDIYLFQYADGLYKIRTSNDTNPRDLWGYEIEMHTYFTKSVDSEGDEIYYVTVPILTEFRIYMPLSDNLHKQWANQNTRLAFLWGDQWGTSTFSPNEYFTIQGYAGGGGDAAYVGNGKTSSNPILKDVTVAFKPSKNLLYLLDKQGEYSKTEFYPSSTATAYPVGGYTLVEDEGEATNGLLGGVIINYKDTDVYGSDVVNIKWENEK